MRHGHFVPGLKGFTLEKRPFAANICADFHSLA
jgi:hypothetical protein